MGVARPTVFVELLASNGRCDRRRLPNLRDEVTVKELEDLTELAEQLDFDSVWTLDRIVVPEASDHQELQYPFGTMDAELAAEVATIDHLSNGRVNVGVGSGWMPEEFAAGSAAHIFPSAT